MESMFYCKLVGLPDCSLIIRNLAMLAFDVSSDVVSPRITRYHSEF